MISFMQISIVCFHRIHRDQTIHNGARTLFPLTEVAFYFHSPSRTTAGNFARQYKFALAGRIERLISNSSCSDAGSDERKQQAARVKGAFQAVPLPPPFVNSRGQCLFHGPSLSYLDRDPAYRTIQTRKTSKGSES